MQGMINVCLKRRKEGPLSLQFYPSMKLSQLAEFLQSCHAAASGTTYHHLRAIVLPPSHLLVDYLLNSPHFLLEDLAKVVHLSQRHSFVKGSDSKRSHLKRQQSPQKWKTLFFMFDGIQESQQLFHYQEQLSTFPFKDQTLTSNAQHIHFRSYISYNEGRGQFLENVEVEKASLTSFLKLERLCVIKNRLLEYGAHYFQVFGDLVEVKESILTITFCFPYVPSVSLQEILSEECSIVIDEIFINKIWAMICHLRNNGFEGFIYEVFSGRHLRHFLDNLFVGINGRLYLRDLNLICEADRQGRFSEREEKELFQEIKAYSKLTKNTNKQTKGKPQEGLSLSFFSTLFLRKHFILHKRSRQNYLPQTDLFTWIKKTTETESSKFYEAVTTKKQKARVFEKKMNEKTKVASKKLRFLRAATRDKRERISR